MEPARFTVGPTTTPPDSPPPLWDKADTGSTGNGGVQKENETSSNGREGQDEEGNRPGSKTERSDSRSEYSNQYALSRASSKTPTESETQRWQFSADENASLQNWQPVTSADESQAVGHGLNPDAPEFAPTAFELAERPRLSLQFRQEVYARAERETEMNWRQSAEHAKERQTFGGGVTPPTEMPEDLGPYASYSSDADRAERSTDGKPIRRTLSETLLASRMPNVAQMDQTSWSESARPVLQYAQPMNAPMHRVQQQATPNPSPRRRPSVMTGPQLGPGHGPAGVEGEGLVIRTRTLLEHQMRANLAFAEAVAAEYGRELAVRVEAQRRAFLAEESRRLQIMELNIRRRIAEAEDALRRQFEEAEANRVRAMEVREAEFERVADDLQRALDARIAQQSEDSRKDAATARFDSITHQQYEQRAALAHWRTNELMRQLETLRHEFELRDQAFKKLQQELERAREDGKESSSTADALARAFAEERDQRMRLEAKVANLQDQNADLEEQKAKNWTVFGPNSPIPGENFEEHRLLANRSPDEIRTTVITLEKERQRLALENNRMSRRVAELEREVDTMSHQVERLRDQAAQNQADLTGSWTQALQTEVLHIEKSLKWTGRDAMQNRETHDRIVQTLREVEKYQRRLSALLPEIPSWSPFPTTSTPGSSAGPDHGKKQERWDSGIYVDNTEGGVAVATTSVSTPLGTGDGGLVGRSDYFGSLFGPTITGEGGKRRISGDEGGSTGMSGPKIVGIIPLKDAAAGPKNESPPHKAETGPMGLSFYDRFAPGGFASGRDPKVSETTRPMTAENSNAGNEPVSYESKPVDRGPFASVPPGPPPPSWFGPAPDSGLTAFGSSAGMQSVTGTHMSSTSMAEARSQSITGGDQPVPFQVMQPQQYPIGLGRSFQPILGPQSDARSTGAIGAIGSGVRQTDMSQGTRELESMSHRPDSGLRMSSVQPQQKTQTQLQQQQHQQQQLQQQYQQQQPARYAPIARPAIARPNGRVMTS
ncbi:hypothetical protein HK104_010955 [Borealophlyctis nickersoniae]|nr:hypothetical protein HK104_010955 [Borealophlyctis nickersoniae]